MFRRFVPKTRQALTFLATIENDGDVMKTLAVISILALLTISGAAYTDQLLTGDQTMQGRELKPAVEAGFSIWGTTTMLSVDQFLRFISVPAVMAAFLIASQVSGAGIFHPGPVQIASR